LNREGAGQVAFKFADGLKKLKLPWPASYLTINKDRVSRTIASNKGHFKSRTVRSIRTYSFTFSTAGTYPYYFPAHPAMTAEV
jgi:hypothetical protein